MQTAFGKAPRAAASPDEIPRLEEIVYFRSWWRKRLIVWARNGTVLEEEWNSYLLSEKFRKIMWSLMVLEDLVYGIQKHCLQKEELLLFLGICTIWKIRGRGDVQEQDCDCIKYYIRLIQTA